MKKMPTIICKRTDAHGTPSGGQYRYNRDLVAYMMQPESKSGDEKCVATFGFGLLRPDMSAREVAAELSMDCELAAMNRPLQSSAVDHWIMSFSDTGMDVPVSKIKNTVDGWLVDMGYARYHKVFCAVHADTDNWHCHMAVCRVNSLTGKLKERTLWKIENQMALVRASRAEGWRLEEGSDYFVCPRNTKPEPVIVKDPLLGTEEKIFRPLAVPSHRWKAAYAIGGGRKRKSAPHVGDRASRMEIHGGRKSGKSVLIERLSGALDNLPESATWLDAHMALAMRGAEMDVRSHGKRKGIVISFDGESWIPASRLNRELSWGALSRRLGDAYVPADAEFFGPYPDGPTKGKALDMVKSIIETRGSVRLAQAEKDIEMEKEQVAALRAVGMDEARKVFAKEAEPKPSGRKPRNAIDVGVYEFALEYAQAVEILARNFPDALEGEPADLRSLREIDAKAAEIAAQKGLKYLPITGQNRLYHTRRRILAQYRAFGVERMDILACIPKWMRVENDQLEAQGLSLEGRERNRRFRDCDIYETFRIVPQLMRVSALGSLGEDNAAHIYCQPRWPEGKAAILVNGFKAGHWDKSQDDPKAVEFLQDNPPTAIMATSDRHPQVLWLVDRKYEPEFYEVLSAELNREFGEGGITGFMTQSRLAGFFNQKEESHVSQFKGKSYETSFFTAEIVRSGKNVRAFESFVEKRHAQWVKDGKPVTPKLKREAFEQTLKLVPLDRAVWSRGMKLQKGIDAWLKALGKDDRSMVDFHTATGLYKCGAGPDEVFTFLFRHGLQNGDFVQRGEDRAWVRNVRDEDDLERKSRRTAANGNPKLMISNFNRKGGDDRWLKDWMHLLVPIARTGDTSAPWQRDAAPIPPVSAEEQIRHGNAEMRRQMAVARRPVSPELRELIRLQDAREREEIALINADLKREYEREIARDGRKPEEAGPQARRPVKTKMGM